MKTTVFRLLIGIAGAYHIALALVGMFLPTDLIIKVAQTALGVVLNPEPQLDLIITFTSAYMLAFGVMLMILSVNPVTYRVLAIPAFILFGVRVINRLIMFDGLLSAGMTPARNITGTSLLLLYAIVLLVFILQKQTGEHAHASTKQNQ